ncbi:MAG: chemotaxis-specific protein-glutamate methyltransferase CheB [Elusimicrobiales bacterium]|nr:chemotaxis-specific protein-glutamate methyltransferase CheB [Elusimicrobiales bacterium]
MIKVLIVDDSRVAQEFLAHILASDPSVQVAGVANNGEEALEMTRIKRPDVITMDIHMPGMDGFEVTRSIMETLPTPIVMVSASSTATEVASSFRMLEAGALALILRPPGIGQPGHEAAARELVLTVKLMSEIKVIRRIRPAARAGLSGPAAQAAGEIQLVAIGASTGGPPALHKILSALPRDLAAPVLIVQHIAAGFTAGFVEWLGGASSFPVHIAAQGETPLPGHAYVAPDGFHMGVSGGPRIELSDQAPENGLRPSVNHLFRSVARVLGPRAVGVLLTGMGRDGADELKTMKDKGAVTIAQDEASSVVHGMPGEAVKLGAATYILPPEGIASMLAGLIDKANGRNK